MDNDLEYRYASYCMAVAVKVPFSMFLPAVATGILMKVLLANVVVV